tara:strand:+ start:134 stop:292 length:159 start_codon:yes stop_codon:yes gene_type:complete
MDDKKPKRTLNLPVNELPEVFDKDVVMQDFDDLLLDKSLYEAEQEDEKDNGR